MAAEKAVREAEEESARLELLFELYADDKKDSTLEVIFSIYDRDGSGFIEKAEVMAIMQASNGYADE